MNDLLRGEAVARSGGQVRAVVDGPEDLPKARAEWLGSLGEILRENGYDFAFGPGVGDLFGIDWRGIEPSPEKMHEMMREAVVRCGQHLAD